MIRLHIIAEGQTEQNFANKVLKPHLAGYNVFAAPRCVLTSKDKRIGRKYSGGLLSYHKAKNDILTWLKEDAHEECRFTTMFDFYALPKDFPGYEEASKQYDPYEKIRILEECMAADIQDRRFIPYIQLHEFEALILADPEKLSRVYLEPENRAKILDLISTVGNENPELINDGRDTAPSKRIINAVYAYKRAKPTVGPAVAGEIGLPVLRTKCRHFHEWLSRLEQLADSPGQQP